MPDVPPPQPAVLSLLVPTRGRPAQVERLLASLRETTARPQRLQVVLYVDEDDTGSHRLGEGVPNVIRMVGPRRTMGALNTACLRRSSGDIVLLGNDDMVVRTHGWDDRVERMHARFPDGIYLAYANDLFMSRKRATFPILSRRCCELLGDPFPEVYRGAFIDTHLFDLFKRLQRAGHDRFAYLEDVVFEHLHYRTGKAAYDETYRRRGRFDDDYTFVALAGRRSQDASRLLRAIRGQLASPGGPALVEPEVPASFPAALALFARKLLLDRELPLKWRAFLFYTHTGRYVAAKGWLGPLVRIGGAQS
jgi:hypothetical protein